MPDTEGTFEDIKGKAKEAAGSVTDDERLEREGEAQQYKADAQKDASEREREAEKSRAAADAHEDAQRANQ